MELYLSAHYTHILFSEAWIHAASDMAIVDRLKVQSYEHYILPPDMYLCAYKSVFQYMTFSPSLQVASSSTKRLRALKFTIFWAVT
jgi:hypothetical protein